MAINHLVNLLIPPRNPPDLPPGDGWATLEARMKVSLPEDYKDFIRSYGSGRISNFIWIFNPFSGNENLNLERQIDVQSKVLAELASYGEVIPYALFPKPGGLLPFGITDNGDVLFWVIDNTPDEWPVVVNGARTPTWERFDLSMSEFLASVLNRQIAVSIFPGNFPEGLPVFEQSP